MYNIRFLAVVLSGLSLVMWAFIRLTCTGLTDVRSVDEFLALRPDQLAEAAECAVLFLTGAIFTLLSPVAVRVGNDGEYRFSRFMASLPWISVTAIGLSSVAMRELHQFGLALTGYSIALAALSIIAMTLALTAVYGNVPDSIIAESGQMLPEEG